MKRPGVVLLMIAVAVLLALAGAGCGADGKGAGDEKETTSSYGATKESSSAAAEGSSAATGPIVETIQIKETDFELEPSEITLDKAGTYAFEAENSEEDDTHALEIEGNGIEAKTEDLEPGQSAELRVDLKPGTYEIYCPVDGHEDLGMKGTITVE